MVQISRFLRKIRKFNTPNYANVERCSGQPGNAELCLKVYRGKTEGLSVEKAHWRVEIDGGSSTVFEGVRESR